MAKSPRLTTEQRAVALIYAAMWKAHPGAAYVKAEEWPSHGGSRCSAVAYYPNGNAPGGNGSFVTQRGPTWTAVLDRLNQGLPANG